jgi:hypothetical protein
MLRAMLFAATITAVALPGVMATGATANSPHMAPHHRYQHAADHAPSQAFIHRAGTLNARPGGYTGANPASHFGSHESSGWYQRGFGGTRDPGWGYNFGPHLGGFGH